MVEIPTVIAVNLGVLAFLAGWAWRGAFDGIRALRSGRHIGSEAPR